jgi:hypothetical protein
MKSIAFIFFMVLLAGCKKNDVLDNSYANKCNCIINGKEWKPIISDTAKPSTLNSRVFLYLHFEGLDSTSLFLKIRNSGIITTGQTYQLNTGATGWTQFFHGKSLYWSIINIDTFSTLKLTKLDTVNKLVAGSFKQSVGFFSGQKLYGDSLWLDCDFDVRYVIQ